MQRVSPAALLVGLQLLVTSVHAEQITAEKVAAVAAIDTYQADLIDLADQIWTFAETALRETRSAALLADYAEARGFDIQRGIAEMPTAFTAEFGSGKPVIGILGEYDALPGISQKATPFQEPLEPGAAGHGCGHNLFGAASLGAALAVKDLIAAGDLQGTIRYYGTPAEESVGGKLYMLRAGLFDDLDAVIAWHPDYKISADTDSSQAMVDFTIEFRGRAAHSASDPWNGRSALDGVELFTHAINLMREHVPPTVRMHYVITDGGKVPNVVPDRAEVWCWIRDSSHQSLNALIERARAAAEGAALATGTEAAFSVRSGSYDMLPNFTGARLLHANLIWLGPIEFDDAEQEFARAIQRNSGVATLGLRGDVQPLELEPGDPEGGSTDVADVSWRVPTIHLSVTTSPWEAPWHAWPVVAAGGTSIGHKGMLYAARAMAATMVDLYQQPQELASMRSEFEEKINGIAPRLFIPEGPPPMPGDSQQ